MTTPTGTEAVREALEGIEAAFAAAARRRAAIVRELATTPPPPPLAADHRTLAEALLRAEAADADPAGSGRDRAARVLAERGRARAARARLAAAAGDELRPYADAVGARCDELDATWGWALDRADALAAGLDGRAAAPVAAAVQRYVAAYRAVLAAGQREDAAAVAAAVDDAEAAAGALEALLAGA